MATVTHDAARGGRAPTCACRARTRSTTCTACSRTTSPTAGSVDALLLTPKARVIAPVLVWRRGDDDLLLLTEPELGEARARPAHAHAVRRQVRDRAGGAHLDDRLRRAPTGSRTATTACRRSRCSTPTLDGEPPTRSSSGCASRRATPRFGREIDDRVLPAEAGLDERAISFTKGCYPGQEPIARQHYRGKVNRRLRVLEVDGDAARAETPVVHGEQGGRPRHERGRRASRSPTCASRCRTTPSSTSTRRAAAATLTAPRARSSGDRALPCGGRGRKFESCRAHRHAVDSDADAALRHRAAGGPSCSLRSADAIAAVEASSARLATRGDRQAGSRARLPLADGVFAVMPCVDPSSATRG